MNILLYRVGIPEPPDWSRPLSIRNTLLQILLLTLVTGVMTFASVSCLLESCCESEDHCCATESVPDCQCVCSAVFSVNLDIIRVDAPSVQPARADESALTPPSVDLELPVRPPISAC